MLAAVAAGDTTIDAAVDAIKTLPYEDLGYAKVDHHRHMRVGVPEVVLCMNKTVDQVRGIIRSVSAGGSNVLATRMSADMYAGLADDFPDATYHTTARVFTLTTSPVKASAGRVGVVTAGTSDMPVAEEAAVTAEALGHPVDRLFDVGVAGIHRLLDNRDTLTGARCLIVVAGMEGALASVVGGLVDCPVVGVPTSVGYGASFGGLAALLGMLNSCASGVAVVNIDNGFGAGYLAHQIAAGADRSP